MAYEEDSGIGLGTVATVGAGIAGIVFRKNIGRFVKDYITEAKRVTDPDALLKKQKEVVEQQQKDAEYGGRTFGTEIIEQDKGIASIRPSQELVPIVDKVEEIKTPKPLTPGQIAQKEAKAVLQKENEFLQEQKKITREQPFTLGGAAFRGDMYGIGSPLYDAVVRKSPSAKPMPVKYWEDFFKKKLDVEFVPFSRKVETVTKDEIADANIAKYNKKGQLVDGYLKYIKDINAESSFDNEVRISPITIMSLIKNAPANNLRVIEHDSLFYKKDTDNLLSFSESVYKAIGGVLPNNFQNKSIKQIDALLARTPEEGLARNERKLLLDLHDIKVKLEQGKGSVSHLRSSGLKRGENPPFDKPLFENPFEGSYQTSESFKNLMFRIGARRTNNELSATDQKIDSILDKPVSSLNYKGGYNVKPDITIREAIDGLRNTSLRARDTMAQILSRSGSSANVNAKKNVFDMTKSYREVSKLMNKLPHVKYPQYEKYRIYGPEDYFESVIYVDPKIIDGVRKNVPNFRITPSHYHNDIFGKSIEGQVLHLRGGVREVDGGGKALSLDEMQNDINQKIQKKIKEKKVKMARDKLDEELEFLKDTPEVRRAVATWKRTKAAKYFSDRQQNMDNVDDAQMFRYYKDAMYRDLTPKDIGELVSKESRIPSIGKKYLFDEAAENKIRMNQFNLDAVGTDLYRDRLLTISDEMSAITDKGALMTRKDIERLKNLQLKHEEISELIPTVSNRPKSKYPHMPFYKKEQWGALGMKYAIRKAAKDDLDWVTINPYEVVHHREEARLGNLEFYGNYRGGGDIRKRTDIKFLNLAEREVDLVKKLADKKGLAPGSTEYLRMLGEISKRKELRAKPEYIELNTNVLSGSATGRKKAEAKGATIPNFMKKFAEDYGTEVKSIRVAKSDPKKNIKIVRDIDVIDADTGKPKKFVEHIAAFTEDEYDALKLNGSIPTFTGGGRVLKRKAGEYYREDYYDTFALKIKPEFKDIPIKGYRKGGLAQNIFKW